MCAVGAGSGLYLAGYFSESLMVYLVSAHIECCSIECFYKILLVSIPSAPLDAVHTCSLCIAINMMAWPPINQKLLPLELKTDVDS